MRLTRFSPALLQIAILLLALLLNFLHIGQTSLWNDEGFSFFVARNGLADTMRFIAEDTQPPLYYLALNLWLGLGTSVFVIRALSAIAMTLALVPLHAAAKRLFNERVALLASLLFALAPLAISWAGKARPYALQTLLVACAFWGFVRVWQSRQQFIGAGVAEAIRRRSLRPAAVDLGWLAYAVGGGLAMLAQAPAGFFLLGCNVAMAISILCHIGRSRIRLLNWVIAQLVLIMIWITWLPTFLHQIAAHLTAEQIASQHAVFLVGFAQVLGSLQSLFAIAQLWRLPAVFAAVYAAIAGFALVQIVRHRSQALPLLAVIFVPVVTCLAGFVLVHPIFGYVITTFIWMLIPYTMLIAFGILSIRPTFLRWGVLALLLTGNVWGIRNVYQSGTPPLDRVASVIRNRMAPGDGIILSEAGSGRWAIAYYLGAPYRIPFGLSVRERGGDGLIQSAAQMEDIHRVWVVVPDTETPTIDMDQLRRHMTPAFEQRVDEFQITLFE